MLICVQNVRCGLTPICILNGNALCKCLKVNNNCIMSKHFKNFYISYNILYKCQVRHVNLAVFYFIAIYSLQLHIYSEK